MSRFGPEIRNAVHGGLALSPGELRLLSSLLDHGLALPVAERESWLGTLGGEAGRLAPVLRELLSKEASKETGDLIERPPAFAAPGTGQNAGDLVGPYRLLRELGHGGMGAVWLAERADDGPRRKVALKLPYLGWAPGLAERFAREGQILASLEHAHIARLYDAGIDDRGRPYMALEYVEGENLDAYCRARSLPVKARVELLLQAAGAVSFAHGRLVVHRDLKPGNILVNTEGQVRLLDFGVAKLMEGDRAAETQLTQLAGRALTLDYASPEQILGEPIGTASDAYSLGVVAYELLAGARPYRLKRGNAAELEEAIAAVDPRLASAATSDAAAKRELRGDLDAILNKALKKDPAERYPTVAAFADDLRRWRDCEPVSARRDSVAYRVRKFVTRHRAPVLGASFAAVALVGLTIAALDQARTAREQTRLARTEARTAEAVEKFLEGIFRSNTGDQIEPLKARQRTALELLDAGVARVDRELDDAPGVKIRVLKTLADMYEDMERIDAAARLHQQRAELALRAFGPGSSAELQALGDAARQFVSMQQHAVAAPLLERGRAILAIRADHDVRARIAFFRAEAKYHLGGEVRRGLAAADEALRLLRETAPSEELVALLFLRSSLLEASGSYAEAIAATKEGLRLSSPPATLGASVRPSLQMQLAELLNESGEIAAADEAFRTALEMNRAHYGPASVQYVVCVQWYAAYLRDTARFGESVRWYEQALDAMAGWSESPTKKAYVAPTLLGVAASLHALGRFPESQAMLDRIDEMLDGDLPNPYSAAGMFAMRAFNLIEVGDHDGAQAALERAREVILARVPAARRDTGARRPTKNVERGYIRLWISRGLPEEAGGALRKWREGVDRFPAPEDEYVIPVMTARVHLLAGDMAEARRIAEQALDRLSKNRYPAALADMEGQLRLALGQALLAQGEAASAVPVLRASLALHEVVYDPRRTPLVASARIALGEALLATGARAEAREMLAKARAIHRSHPRLGDHYTRPLRRLEAALAQ